MEREKKDDAKPPKKKTYLHALFDKDKDNPNEDNWNASPHWLANNIQRLRERNTKENKNEH